MDAPREDPAAARRRRPRRKKDPHDAGGAASPAKDAGAGGRSVAARSPSSRVSNSSSSAGRGNPRNVVAGRASSSPARPGTPFDEDAMGPEPELGGRCRADDGTWLAWELALPRAGASPSRPLVILVNGLSNDGMQWRRLKPAMTRTHAVLSWDYRGHGCSADPTDVSSVSIRALAGDLERVLADARVRSGGAVSTRRVALVAYSLGCQVALEWCRGNSHRVCGLALVLGSCRHAMTGALRWKPVADVAAAAMRIAPAPAAYAWDCFTAFAFAFSYASHLAARLFGMLRVKYVDFEPFYRHLKRLHAGSYTRMLISGQEHSAMDVLELVDRREIPTLIVTGGKDVTASASGVRAMHHAAPRADFVHLPGACHAGMIGEAEAVGDAIGAFLDRAAETLEFNRARVLAATGVDIFAEDADEDDEDAVYFSRSAPTSPTTRG